MPGGLGSGAAVVSNHPGGRAGEEVTGVAHVKQGAMGVVAVTAPRDLEHAGGEGVALLVGVVKLCSGRPLRNLRTRQRWAAIRIPAMNPRVPTSMPTYSHIAGAAARRNREIGMRADRPDWKS